MSTVKYKRILLKLSGEALLGGANFGINLPALTTVARQIKQVVEKGVEVGIVVGGGNLWRGADVARSGMDRTTADYVGMLATVINAIVLQDAMEREGLITRTQSAIPIQAISETYIRRRAIRHLEKGRVVIFAGGTGNPHMTTDTAAALRAIEIDADVLLMAKNRVDGIYDADPIKNPGAKKFEQITHLEALNRHLEVLDATAFSLCMENKLAIIVFNLHSPSSIERVVSGETIGTLVYSERENG